LRVTRDADWEAWVLYMLRGLEVTARWTTLKIAALRALQSHTAEYLTHATPKIYGHELLTLIFELPYCRISDLTGRGIAKRHQHRCT